MRRAPPRRFLALLGALLLLASAPGSALAGDFRWEDSKAEDVVAKVSDALIVRPLACLKFAASVAFFVPAAIFAAPGGRASIEDVYDTLVESSVDYAFRRKFGEF